MSLLQTFSTSCSTTASNKRRRKESLEAIELLDSTAETVAAETALPEATRQLLGRRIQRTRSEIEQLTGKRRNELELDRQNKMIEAKIDQDRGRKIEVDQRLATLVEEYNVLIDEQRFAEAEVIAKKAAQLSRCVVAVSC